MLRDMYNSYVYNTGPEENQFFQPHLDDAHSKLVHRSNYLHFGTTKRQISKATTQGWRPPPLPNVRAATISWVAVVSTTSENPMLPGCFHVDCMSEYFRIRFTVTFNAFKCHFCPRLVSKYVGNGKHLPFESGPSTYGDTLSWSILKVEFHLHETLNMQHAWSCMNTLSKGNDLQNVDERKLQTVQGILKQSSNLLLVMTCSLKTSANVEGAQHFQFEPVSNTNIQQQHEEKTHPHPCTHFKPRKWLVSIDPPRWKRWLLR